MALHGASFSLLRLWRAAGFTAAGLRAAFIEQAAFRLELALCVVLVPLGFWLGRDGVERALLVGSLLVVLIVELVNSSIEAMVNRIGAERHPLSGQAKDVASAAVFVALLLVVVIWALVLSDRFA